MNDTADKSATIIGSLSIPLWSMTPLMIVLLPKISPFFLMGFRFMITGGILAAIAAYRGKSFIGQFRHPPGVWALSVMGILVSQIIYIFSLQFAPAAEVNFVNYLWPLFVVMLTGYYTTQKFEPRYGIGALLGLGGCSLIILGDIRGTFSITHMTGYQLALIAGISWALYSFFMRRNFASTQSSIQGGPFLLFSIICFALHYQFSGFVPAITQKEWLYLLIFSLIPLAYSLWEHGIKRGDLRLLAVTSYFIPFLSAIWIVCFTGKTGSPYLWLGGSLVVLAPIVASYNWPRFFVIKPSA